ncbi:PAS domain S-box protein [Haloplanus aerogenes]|uniref:histidine kinase n=1 Tax=Haloplanus aerogenes TaxID=660522 RepID=A0A3M0DP71_9EURY|nr:PAS domain S-box protein [Haloplanus aerogenes]AZH24680.1 PAS domain S-box protein [Haloplanus aerogenes]RMB23661.1 PAS domain S-box-containing protein [Haloplanus aerogenes]
MNNRATVDAGPGYRALFEHVSDGLLVFDPETGTVRDANDRFASMSGFDHGTLVGRHVGNLLSDGWQPDAAMRELVATARDDGATVEWRLRRRDGEPFWVELSASLAELGDEECVLTTVRDVTERKRRRDELGRFEELVEHVPTGIFRAKRDGTFVEANPTMVDLFDADAKVDLLSTPVEEIYDDADDFRAFFDALAERDMVTEKIRLRTLTGDTFWGLITVCRFEGTDGETYLDGAIKDVTETREYQQVLEEQNERLELLNRIVRHDIRNDMQLVQGMTDLLDDLSDDAEQPHLETIKTRVEHVVELTDLMDELMDALVSEADDDLEPTNLSFVLDREVREASSSYPDATIRTRGNVPLVEVTANDMLRSVFRNLLNNAIQHHDRDEPTVEVSAEVEDGWVLVQVADDGPGIDPGRRETVFGKGKKGIDSEGTGLGLYLVYTLVDHYGGAVWINDNEPRGSVFNVRLRLA